MQIALVHDDLVQWGGAERVLDIISEIYPHAPIYTSVFDQDNKTLVKRFKNKNIQTSFLQTIPGWKNIYKMLLPLYPIAFEQFDFSKYDLVISHGTRFAKSIITKSSTRHVNYCHTPPRFLWNFSGEKLNGFLQMYLSYLRFYDSLSSKRVDNFLAGSINAQERIEKIYKRTSKVLQPPIDLRRFEDIEAFDGGYFIVVSRLNKYKRVDLTIKACGQLGLRLKIIGSGPETDNLKSLANQYPGIEFMENIDDKDVVKVMAGSRGLIISGIEDFGLTSLEAQALGKPVIAFGVGGVLETVKNNETGIFFKEQKANSLKEALIGLDNIKIDPHKCKENANSFSKEKFVKEFQQSIAQFL